MTRKYREISGMPLRKYLRRRKLAFALKDVRDSEKSLPDIAVDYGFPSQETFIWAYGSICGVAPGAYCKAPTPVVLRTIQSAFDHYLFGMDEIDIARSTDDVKVYFITLRAHKLLHVENLESNKY
jgi:AraC family transcriptional regulator